MVSHAIRKVKRDADKFFPKWLEQHPNCWEQESPYHEQYMTMVTNRFGKGEENFQEKNTKKYETIKQDLYDFSSLILDTESGFYFKGNIPSESELINGAMKMITGFDWLGIPIHKPEKIIDKALSIKVSGYGCDLVDIVYVLYKCSEHTNYRRKDILKYFNYLEGVIAKHYFKDEKAFSYNVDRSQIYYYGLKITRGLKTPDLHGTLLLLWALSMINDFANVSSVITSSLSIASIISDPSFLRIVSVITVPFFPLILDTTSSSLIP